MTQHAFTSYINRLILQCAGLGLFADDITIFEVSLKAARTKSRHQCVLPQAPNSQPRENSIIATFPLSQHFSTSQVVQGALETFWAGDDGKCQSRLLLMRQTCKILPQGVKDREMTKWSGGRGCTVAHQLHQIRYHLPNLGDNNGVDRCVERRGAASCR